MKIELDKLELDIVMSALHTEFKAWVDTNTHIKTVDPSNEDFYNRNIEKAQDVVKVFTELSRYSVKYDYLYNDMVKQLESYALTSKVYSFKAELIHSFDTLYADFEATSQQAAELKLKSVYGPIIKSFELINTKPETLPTLKPEYKQADSVSNKKNYIYRLYSGKNGVYNTKTEKFVTQYIETPLDIMGTGRFYGIYYLGRDVVGIIEGGPIGDKNVYTFEVIVIGSHFEKPYGTTISVIADTYEGALKVVNTVYPNNVSKLIKEELNNG